MPAYDYKCESCNENFVYEKSMSDNTTPDCPKCNSKEIKRIWGGFQVKGGAGSKDCGSCSGSSCSTCK